MGGFRFKQFIVEDHHCQMKVGTDGVLLGAWADVEGAARALDIGTGCGVIAMMLAQRNPSLLIDAVEARDSDAVQAAQNVRDSPWPGRIVVHSQLIQKFQSAYQYDVIVTNPPFFINSALPPDPDRASARHTQMLTHEELLHAIKRLLKPTGRFSIIIPSTGYKSLVRLAAMTQLFPSRLLKFHTRANRPAERHLVEFSYESAPCVEETITLYAGSGQRKEDWSDDYRRLVGDFYL